MLLLLSYSVNPDCTNSTRLSTAACSSAPSAMMRMVVPPTMPKDKTPSKLFAFTLRSSFSTQMDYLDSFAFWIINVAGRACKPTWFCTTTSLTYMFIHSYTIIKSFNFMKISILKNWLIYIRQNHYNIIRNIVKKTSTIFYKIWLDDLLQK